MYRSLCASLSCACLLWIALPVRAQAEPLTFREAIQRTLKQHPDLAAFAYELGAQEGRVQSAGARMPVEIGVLVENALGSGARGDFDAAETTVSLGFMLEGNAIERRRASALAGRDLLATELKEPSESRER